MGCVSSKLFKKEFERESLFTNDENCGINHVVSLTSSTYGALKLDADEPTIQLKRKSPKSPQSVQVVLTEEAPAEKVVEELEIINAWELMGDLEEEEKEKEEKGVLNLVKNNSSKKQMRFSGKENKYQQRLEEPSPSPKQVLKPFNSVQTAPTFPLKRFGTPTDLKSKSFRMGSRRSLSPLFDPELIASIERELNEEQHIKKKKIIVSPKPRNLKSQDSVSMLELFEDKCPPGGENAVVIYTTTLRGIRKTFEDCNSVRSIVESHHVQVIERDVSMHSGFREELRVLMGGKKGVKVPLVFVKGRLIGGADEVVRMEEEGQLGVLLRGIPAAMGGCAGCGGMRFVVCVECSGSCKMLDEVERKMVRCGECNENGLIQCPICCC